MSNKPATWLGSLVMFCLILAIGLASDLWSKDWVFRQYYPYFQQEGPPEIQAFAPHWWIDGVLGIQTSTNGGALFGMMQGFQAVFIGLSLFAFVCILAWLFALQAYRDRLLVFCLAMISGGILGNLYDRLGWWHQAATPPDAFYEVRDWIHFRLAGIPMFDPWPNFNIADSLLVVGVGLMLVQSFLAGSEQQDEQEEIQAEPESATQAEA